MTCADNLSFYLQILVWSYTMKFKNRCSFQLFLPANACSHLLPTPTDSDYFKYTWNNSGISRNFYFKSGCRSTFEQLEWMSAWQYDFGDMGRLAPTQQCLQIYAWHSSRGWINHLFHLSLYWIQRKHPMGLLYWRMFALG